MIPLMLQDRLIERMSDTFKDTLLKNMKGERVPLKYYRQHLPNKSKIDSDSPYPCIIVRLSNGNKTSEADGQSTTVQFIVGIIDRDDNNQGYQDVMTIINRIIEDLTRQPMIDNLYEVDPDMNWSYHDEDVEPYFFAGLETTWHTPQYLREDVEHLI